MGILGGLLLGVAVGIVSGLVGIGGGVLLIPALVLFYKMSQHKAQGTSLAILLLPIGALAFGSTGKRGGRPEAGGAGGGRLCAGWLAGRTWAVHLSDVVLRRGSRCCCWWWRCGCCGARARSKTRRN